MLGPPPSPHTQTHPTHTHHSVCILLRWLQTLQRFVARVVTCILWLFCSSADSIRSYLQLPLENEFVEQELAEPEPGKRYAIGQGLLPYLKEKQQKSVPTLAFTMPHESDAVALQNWVAHLKALFPNKPVPKAKAQRQSVSCWSCCLDLSHRLLVLQSISILRSLYVCFWESLYLWKTRFCLVGFSLENCAS